MKYKAVSGTKDILPDEVVKWQFVERKIRDIMELYNYKEIRTPVFEETELFARSIGEYTDIVKKEMYTFTDNGKRSLTLKPEITAPVVRAFIENHLEQQGAHTKLYYISPAFRQERPQAGRQRQFHQFGVEAIGSPNPEQDVETIMVAMHIYESIGLTNITLRINSVGTPEFREIYKEKLKSFLKPKINEFSKESKMRFDTNPLRILDSKADQDKLEDIPILLDYISPDCFSHFQTVKERLTSLNIDFEVNPKLVRGLDYYTRTAFEIISGDLGSQDALAGGGRYDLLIEELGGKSTPAVGFAAGMERLIMVMDKQNLPFGEKKHIRLFIAAIGDDAKEWALNESYKLRRRGVSVDMDFLGRSLKAQLRVANRLNAQSVLVIGDDELKTMKGSLKNMETGEQHEIEFDNILNYLQ